MAGNSILTGSDGDSVPTRSTGPPGNGIPAGRRKTVFRQSQTGTASQQGLHVGPAGNSIPAGTAEDSTPAESDRDSFPTRPTAPAGNGIPAGTAENSISAESDGDSVPTGSTGPTGPTGPAGNGIPKRNGRKQYSGRVGWGQHPIRANRVCQ